MRPTSPASSTVHRKLPPLTSSSSPFSVPCQPTDHYTEAVTSQPVQRGGVVTVIVTP
jgi:hypothetical protein